MKRADFLKSILGTSVVAPLAAVESEPTVAEVKPGGKYIIVFEQPLPEEVADAIIRDTRRANEKHGVNIIGVLHGGAKIYDIS
jgi:hypothetical protein